MCTCPTAWARRRRSCSISSPGSARRSCRTSRAAHPEVEAADVELLVGIRRPLHVLLDTVVLVRLQDRDPRQVLEEDLGHALVRAPAEVLVDAEARRVAELVPLR